MFELKRLVRDAIPPRLGRRPALPPARTSRTRPKASARTFSSVEPDNQQALVVSSCWR